jgi:cyclopropane fatty-acyl-phospholipid synthase-like methyltransferase
MGIAMTDVSYDPASHYDRVTAAWTLLLGHDLHYGVFDTGTEALPDATAALTQRMIDAAKLDAGAEVLDVGCGTGAPACHLAAAYGVSVVGITTSAVGVASARERAEAAGLADRVSFEERDGMDNGFADVSFDRTWVLESSHLMRERDRVIAECARVLRPGGRLTLCDIMLRRPMPFKEVRRLREPLELLREVFGEARMEPLGAYVELAEANGLVVDVSDDLTEVTRPTFARWRDNAERHRDEVIALLAAEDHQRFVDSTVVLEGFWDDGTLGYGLIAAAKP